MVSRPARGARTSPEDLRKRAEEALHARLTAAVQAGVKTVDEAVSAARAEIAAIGARVDEIEKAERRFAMPGADEERRKDGRTFSFLDVCMSLACNGAKRGIFAGDGRNVAFDASMEWAMAEEMARHGELVSSTFATRAANETDTGAGGAFLVPGSVLTGEIIPLLKAQVIAFALGARQRNFSTFPIEIPKVASSFSPGGAQENVALAESEMTFDMMRLEPHACGAFTKVSRRFFSYGEGAEQILRENLAEDIALKWNLWYLKGTGINDEPLGILQQAGNSVSAAAGSDSASYEAYTDLLKMEEKLAEDNVILTNVKWAAGVKFLRWVRSIKGENASAGTDSADVARKIVGQGADKTVIGYPYVITSQLASSPSASTDTEIILGDYTQSTLATFGTMMLEASNTANDALQKRQTHIASWIDVDVGVRQPNAFCALSGLDLSSF